MKKMRTLLLVFDQNYTFFPFIKRKNITIATTWMNTGALWGKGVRLCEKLPFLADILLPRYLNSWYKDVTMYDKIIIFDSAYCKSLGKWIQKNAPKAQKYVYLWDGKNRTRIYQDSIFPVFSYNSKDEKLGFGYNPVFWGKELAVNESVEKKRDIYYAGRVRDREKQIEAVIKTLTNTNLFVKYNIVDEKGKISEIAGIKVNHRLCNYDKILKECEESDALLEIENIQEQGAYTLRVMEALFLNKKLITTNRQIMEAPFYRKEQFFTIYDNMSADLINQFMNEKIESVNDKWIDYFDIDSWIDRFGG